MNRLELIKALEIVKPGLANKEMIEQSSSFAFLNGRVVTYNDEISISHPIEGLEITGAIKADALYGLLSKIKKEDVEITITENEILVNSGRTKAGIILETEVKLPLEELGDTTKWKKLPATFNDYLKFASEACSSDNSIANLTCVNVLKRGLMQSSDNYKLLQITMEKLPVHDFLIPYKQAALVTKMKPTYISESKGWVHFKTTEDTIISCRIFFGDTFPDFTKALEVKNGKEIIFPSSLIDVLDRAYVFAKRSHEQDESVQITLQKKQLIVKSKSDVGRFEESINIAYNDETIVFEITPYLLKDILSRTTKCIIGKDKLKFEESHWQYISILKS